MFTFRLWSEQAAGDLPLVPNAGIRADEVKAAVLVPRLLEALCLAVVISDVALVEADSISELFDQSGVGLDVYHCDSPALANQVHGKSFANA